MAKIKLGAHPKSFVAPVKVTLLDGTEGVVNMKFRYRTRTEFGAFLDEINAENGVMPSVENEDPASVMQRAYATGVDRHAGQIMRAAEGWDLDEEFSLDNVKACCDEFSGVALAIMESYRRAITEGRLGN